MGSPSWSGRELGRVRVRVFLGGHVGRGSLGQAEQLGPVEIAAALEDLDRAEHLVTRTWGIDRDGLADGQWRSIRRVVKSPVGAREVPGTSGEDKVGEGDCGWSPTR